MLLLFDFSVMYLLKNKQNKTTPTKQNKTKKDFENKVTIIKKKVLEILRKIKLSENVWVRENLVLPRYLKSVRSFCFFLKF